MSEDGITERFERGRRSQNVEQARIDNLYLNAAMRQQRCDDGHVRRIAVFGAGSPVIFVPMICELAFVYAPQMAVLQAQFKTILYEPRIRHDSSLHVEERVAELMVVMRTVGVASAHIVAWSDTGAVAYRLASEHPDCCLSVSFLTVPDRYRLPLPIHFGMQVLRKWPLPRLLPAFLLRQLLAYFMSGPTVRYREVVELARSVPDLSRVFVYSCLPNMMEHMPTARPLHVPAMVVYGDRDPVVRPAQAQALASLMGPRAKSWFVAEGEHLLPWSNDVPTAEALLNFLAAVERKAL
ncbi:MAG: alpha/beta hydrolase [Xanthobacteraceae bacterium]|nr:alpha/beta hydrolase [Xanthobacteraceae bacterium]